MPENEFIPGGNGGSGCLTTLSFLAVNIRGSVWLARRHSHRYRPPTPRNP